MRACVAGASLESASSTIASSRKKAAVTDPCPEISQGVNSSKSTFECFPPRRRSTIMFLSEVFPHPHSPHRAITNESRPCHAWMRLAKPSANSFRPSRSLSDEAIGRSAEKSVCGLVFLFFVDMCSRIHVPFVASSVSRITSFPARPPHPGLLSWRNLAAVRTCFRIDCACWIW